VAIDNPDHLSIGRIDLNLEVRNCPMPSDVRAVNIEAFGIQDAPALEFRGDQITKRKSFTANESQIVVAALLEGFDHARILLCSVSDAFDLFSRDGCVDVRALLPREEFARDEVHLRLESEALAEEDDVGNPEERIACLPREDTLLRRFVQKDSGNPRIFVQFSGIAQDILDSPVFLSRQSREWVVRN